jgi:hypothetical protein
MPSASIPTRTRLWSPARLPVSPASAARFLLQDLRKIAGRVDSGAAIVALPDPLVGRRLIGNAANRNMMQAALSASASIRSSSPLSATAASAALKASPARSERGERQAQRVDAPLPKMGPSR